jgi:hypothetical protein
MRPRQREAAKSDDLFLGYHMSRLITGLFSVLVSATAGASPAFVQQNYAVPSTPQSTVSVSYKNAQVAGNTNIVAVGYNDATHTISSISDSQGNTYLLAVPLLQARGFSQAYYASNIKAGLNTVKIVLNGATPYVDLRVTEYSGLASSGAFVAGASVSGTSTAPKTPSITTTDANSLLFAAGMTLSSFRAAGSGYTTRVITDPDADIVEDSIAVTPGLYGASASANSAANILQIAAFRPPVANPPPPPAPSPAPAPAPAPAPSPAPLYGPTGPVGPQSSITCSGVNVAAGANIQSAINANGTNTTFCLAPGTYQNQTVVPKSGDKIIGSVGTILDGGNSVAQAIVSNSVSNVTISNLVVQNYNGTYQVAAVDSQYTTGWTFKNLEIRYNASEGINVGDNTLVQFCYIHHNGDSGYGNSGQGVGIIFDSNEIAFQNYQNKFSKNDQAGGGKLWATTGAVMTHNYSHDNHGTGMWADNDNTKVTYTYNRVENNWRSGIMQEISYSASIHDNYLSGNANSAMCRTWLWCSDIVISGSGGTGGEIIEIYNNTIITNSTMGSDGIGLIEQARGSGVQGPYILQNIYVHDNNIDMSAGGQTGAVEDNGDTALFTRNIKFDRNNYTLGNNTNAFEWNNGQGGKAFWQSFGLDLNGTFK